jgi:hypothetical protein
VIENILNSQRPGNYKSGLECKQINFEKGSSSMSKEAEQKSYEESIRSPKPSKENIQVMEEDQLIRGKKSTTSNGEE